MTERQAIRNVEATLNAFFAEQYENLFGHEPRWRYFRRGQTMFCWTTEPFSDGRYAAFIYQPEGKGSRVGKATQWRKRKELRFRQRNTAKARALAWWKAASDGR